MITAALYTASCKPDESPADNEDNTPAPVLTVTDDNMDIPAGEGTYDFSYTLENEAGGRVSASTEDDADWLGGFDTSVDGVVSFTVEANLSTEPRAATVTVTYTYGEGLEVSDNLTVTQAGTEEVPEDKPEITVTTETVMVDGEGSDVYQIEYTLDRKGTEGDVTASAGNECDWIEEFSYFSGAVMFTVTPNETGQERSTTVILTYTYGEGESVSASAEVVQATVKQPAEDPVLTISGNTSFSFEGEQTAQLRAEITNPFSDGAVSATCEADWITDISVMGSNSLSYITFNVLENNSSERSAQLVITYTYGGGNSISESVTLEQEAGQSSGGGDHNVNATSCTSEYLGDYGNNGERNYTLTLSDGGGTDYAFDIYIDSSKEEGDYAGTYQYDEEGYSAGTFSWLSVIMTESSSLDMTGGTLVISGSGDSYSITADITDSNNETHHITYSGPIN